MREVRPPRLPLASLALIGLAGVAVRTPLRRRLAVLAVPSLVLAALAYPFARASVPGLGVWAPGATQTAVVDDDLLTNVYRSFDLREEEAIYDRLAVSVTGDQLADVYLEHRRAAQAA